MINTKSGHSIAVEEISWNYVVKKSSLNNLELAETMNLIGGNDSNYKFYKAVYQFGDKIISNGNCYLSLTNGDSISFNDPDLPDSLRNDLSYNEIEDPLGLVLCKSSEFYLPDENKIEPKSIIHPGQFFGIPRAIDDNTSDISTSVLELNLNAGIRSLFILSGIGNNTCHKSLQEHYGTKLTAPDSSQDHWELFADITRKTAYPWCCEIIYFPRNWINKLKKNEWALLAKRLMLQHRTYYSIWHRVSDIWKKAFEEIEQEKELTKVYPMQSLIIAKQLFMLAANVIPGFQPATDDNSAPISLIKEVYSKVYNERLKQKYSINVMELAKIGTQTSNPIYFSLNQLTFKQNYLDASNKKSQITLLDEIRRATENYLKIILESKRHVKTLYDVAKTTTFSFYHTNPDSYTKILSATLLPNDDIRFTHNQYEEFPYTSGFFKGCVKISRTNT
ncbi:MAG: hypothetical protein K0R49_641 [Burkholderiales bacterium]|jgi:hypothetical protein|nr:hypothetical protein [Burkholderiales bacterium]